MASSISPDLLRQIPGYDPYATAGGCRFDDQAARRALDFFPRFLTHVKGALARQPFILEPWQQAIIANLFGWKRPDGTRRYREAFVFVPRKNGKSILIAGIVNLFLFTDNEPGAEVYSAAAEREQARLVFEMARGMIENSPELLKRASLYKYSIVVGSGSYKAISADAHTKHGFNTHLAVIDELHAQHDRELVDVLSTSTGARRQPLILHITTSDFERPGSICNEKHDYAGKVRDGIIHDNSFLPVIYEASRDDDWTLPETWAKANPNLGVSVSEEYLRRECEKAQETPAYENTFKRLHLNIRTEQDIRWLAMEKYDACDAELPELDGRQCYAGLDLANTKDVAALVLAFQVDECYALLPRFWVPEESIAERSRRDRVPYDIWAKQGWITATPGNVIDYEYIRQTVNELGKRYQILEIAADRWNATQLIQQLAGDGFTIFPFGQGFKDMTAPTKQFDTLVTSGRLIHGANPVLRWMASNTSVEQDAAGNLKPSKKKSSEKIDGIVAAVMALGRAMVAVPPPVIPEGYEVRFI